MRAWDAGAVLWADHVRHGGDVRWEAHAAVLAEILPPSDGLTVDAGCGEGRFTRNLRARGYNTVGFDTTAALVDAARAADPTGMYEVADVCSLPLGDDGAQLVTCINVLQHVADLDAALAEFARVPVGGRRACRSGRSPTRGSRYVRRRTRCDFRQRLLRRGSASRSARRRRSLAPSPHDRVVRASLGAAGFTLDDLREVPGRSASVPLYLDLRARR